MLYECLFIEGCFSLLLMHVFGLVKSSSVPCNRAFTADRIRKAEEAPEDPVASGTVKEQAYLWQMLLLEAGGDTA